MSHLYHPVTLGPLTVPGNLFAAPMAGYTDAVSRFLALEGGADLAFTEMISAEALVRKSARTREMMQRGKGERILAVQLFGSDPDVLGRAAALCRETGADLLDLNAGCPVNKVVAKGAGAALARDRRRLADSISAMCESGLPVMVKLRSGWNDEEIDFRENAPALVEAGAAAVGFHPRTREQGYGGKADWSLVTELAGELRVPVVGSGDLYSPEDARRMLTETGCAAVMFARGAVGDPNIYGRTRRLLEGSGPAPDTGRAFRLGAALRHLELAAEKYGDERAYREMKKHLAGYVRGWDSAATLRRDLMGAGDIDTLRARLTAGSGRPESGEEPSREG